MPIACMTPLVEITVAALPRADPSTACQLQRSLHWPSCTGTTEKQNVSVGVLELESTQAVIVVLEWLRKLDIARREFCCQRVRIGDVEVSVPAGPAFFDVSLVVRQWIYANVLEHDHRGTPPDDAEKDRQDRALET